MKKVCVICGGKIKKSISKKYIKKILDKIEEIDCTYFELKKINIELLSEGESLFEVGPLLFKDDSLQEVIDAMQVSEVIFWVTPTYLQHISGIFKVFLDRISPFAHTMELAGKLGGIFVTSNGSDTSDVIKYLKKIQLSMGIKNIFAESIMDPTVTEKEIKNFQYEFKKSLEENYFLSSGDLEAYFANLQKIFCKNEGGLNNLEKYLIKFLREVEIDKFNSFQEFAEYNCIRLKSR